MSYIVYENIADTSQHFNKADYVLAFCGNEMFIIKSRTEAHLQTPTTPHKPDKVIAYYSWPEPRVAELRLRSGNYDTAWCRMGHATGQRGCALCEEF